MCQALARPWGYTKVSKATPFFPFFPPSFLSSFFYSFIHSFIHLFKYLLTTYSVPGSILSFGDTKVSRLFLSFFIAFFSSFLLHSFIHSFTCSSKLVSTYYVLGTNLGIRNTRWARCLLCPFLQSLNAFTKGLPGAQHGGRCWEHKDE